MIKCTYCGIENDETVFACRGCGTLLSTPEVNPTKLPPAVPQIDAPPALNEEGEAPDTPPPRGRELTASTAGVVFLVYLVSQVIGSALARDIGFAVAAGQGQSLQDAQEIMRLVPTLMPGIVLGAMIGGGVGMFAMAFVLVPRSFGDCSPTGAAWIQGSWLDVGKGLVL